MRVVPAHVNASLHPPLARVRTQHPTLPVCRVTHCGTHHVKGFSHRRQWRQNFDVVMSGMDKTICLTLSIGYDFEFDISEFKFDV